MDVSLDSAGERPVIRLERHFPHSVGKVWVAITDPAELDGWFPWRSRIDLRVGGTIEFRDTKSGLRMDAVITELDPPRVFAYLWGGERLRWELHEDGAGCRLVFTHEIAERPGAAKFAAGWHLCVDALAARLDGVDNDAPPNRIAELNRRYVRDFGLLDGEIADTAGGPALRFDQELLQPPAAVWAALRGSDAVAGGPVPAPATVDPGAAGPLTEVRPNDTLAYDARGGTVRWTLRGQPFGTRLTLVQTGPLATLTAARPAWSGRLAELAERLDGAVNR